MTVVLEALMLFIAFSISFHFIMYIKFTNLVRYFRPHYYGVTEHIVAIVTDTSLGCPSITWSLKWLLKYGSTGGTCIDTLDPGSGQEEGHDGLAMLRDLVAISYYLFMIDK